MDVRPGSVDAADPHGGRPIDPRGDLGRFLRSRRARLRPDDVGLPATGRHRRVPGLRREELAQLAGVSVAYLTRLEQGRGHNVSAEVLDAIARALRLTEAEHTHLTHLVKCQRRTRDAQSQRDQVRPTLRQMLASLEAVPAYVTGRRTDVLAWNATAGALFDDWDDLPPRDLNWARLVFQRPDYRRLLVDWEATAADVVASLRLYAGCQPDDPQLLDLVADLSADSEDFRRLWAGHDVKESSHGVRRLRHRLVGELTVSFESFRLADDSEQSLVVYHTQPGSASAQKLRRLADGGAETAAVPPLRCDQAS